MHVRIDVQGAQVPAVHADDGGAAVGGALQFRRVVDLHERGHVGDARLGQEVAPARDRSSAPTMSRTASAPDDDRFEDLISRDDEVLAEQRQLDGGADRLEVIERAVEERRFRQHGDRGSPGVRVRACVIRGAIVGTQDAA